MRNKIRNLLIRLANWIGDKTYYDFGSEVVGMIVFKDNLYVNLKDGVMRWNGKKWKRVSK